MKCKFCKRKNSGPGGICWTCRKKHQAFLMHKVFRTDEEAERAKLVSERKPLPRRIILECPNTYKNKKHKIGSDTKKLIDFVNKSGTIHYGRYVAQQRGKER